MRVCVRVVRDARSPKRPESVVPAVPVRPLTVRLLRLSLQTYRHIFNADELFQDCNTCLPDYWNYAICKCTSLSVLPPRLC